MIGQLTAKAHLPYLLALSLFLTILGVAALSS